MSKFIKNVSALATPGVSARFRNLFQQIQNGDNPSVKFKFTDFKCAGSTQEHPPSIDNEEVRNSLTLEFKGAPPGRSLAHLFNDGELKFTSEMQEEVRERSRQEELLATEEAKFPELAQTPVRQQAHRTMMDKIRSVRDDGSVSMINKQLRKDNAKLEYQRILREQAEERAAAGGK